MINISKTLKIMNEQIDKIDPSKKDLKKIFNKLYIFIFFIVLLSFIIIGTNLLEIISNRNELIIINYILFSILIIIYVFLIIYLKIKGKVIIKKNNNEEDLNLYKFCKKYNININILNNVIEEFNKNYSQKYDNGIFYYKSIVKFMIASSFSIIFFGFKYFLSNNFYIFLNYSIIGIALVILTIIIIRYAGNNIKNSLIYMNNLDSISPDLYSILMNTKNKMMGSKLDELKNDNLKLYKKFLENISNECSLDIKNIYVNKEKETIIIIEKQDMLIKKKCIVKKVYKKIINYLQNNRSLPNNIYNDSIIFKNFSEEIIAKEKLGKLKFYKHTNNEK